MIIDMEMNKHKTDSYTRNSRKRKRKQKGIIDNQIGSGIDKLPDDILIAILSCMSLKDAVKTSLLYSRWRYLWTFTSGSLEFDDTDTSTGTIMKRKEFKGLVNRVLKLHQGRGLDSLVIRFTNLRFRARSSDIDSWIYFAMHKGVKRFELNLSVQNGFHCNYKFPSIDKLLLRAQKTEVKSAFGSLRSLRLVDVDTEDEVVQYFLVSCPYIEQLCIRASHATKNLEFVDPLLSLKELEISDCINLQSMEISAVNLVSCKYQGSNISSPFKKTPYLSELTLGGFFCKSFILEPSKHSSYSVHLVTLVLNLQMVSRERTYGSPDFPQLCCLKRLELNIVSRIGKSLLFFKLLIKASTNLQEFKIKMHYPKSHLMYPKMPYPIVSPEEAAGGFRLEKLKVIEMFGFHGYSHEKELLVNLAEVAPSVEMVCIDTETDFFRIFQWPEYIPKKTESMFREESRKIAMKIKAKFPSESKFIVT